MGQVFSIKLTFYLRKKEKEKEKEKLVSFQESKRSVSFS
jgi:hypothetical protein